MFESSSQTIKNIYNAVQRRDLNAKVEPNDAQLNESASRQLVKDYWQYKSTTKARLGNYIARETANSLSALVNRNTELVGLDKWDGIQGGAILTSNHFSPLENTAIRQAINKTTRQPLYIVSQETNLLTSEPLKFLFWNYDILPITSQATDINYMGREFPAHIKQVLDQGNIVMIYPEQEMWYNYRKPRPVKLGAYHYAAKFNVPIRSCFVEIIDDGIQDNPDFNHTHYRVHVLDNIYPIPTMSVRENTKWMAQVDYNQKVAAYEKAYGKPLTYSWQPGDVVGLRDEDALLHPAAKIMQPVRQG